MNPVSLVVNVVQMCLLDCLILIVYLVSTHYTGHKRNVHFKCLANSLALVYNFYSPIYNSRELAEDYGWKNVVFPFLLSFCSVLCYMFA